MKYKLLELSIPIIYLVPADPMTVDPIYSITWSVYVFYFSCIVHTQVLMMVINCRKVKINYVKIVSVLTNLFLLNVSSIIN